MSVGKSGGSPSARISLAKPRRRKCSIVRACVALACGLNAVVGFWSTRTAPTPRRPSSFASIQTQGPPPTIRTEQLLGGSGFIESVPSADTVFRQYLPAIGNSSAGNSEIRRQLLSVTTTSSSMRAAEKPSVAGQKIYIANNHPLVVSVGE